MYISEIDKNDLLVQTRKSKLAYLGFALLAVLVAKIYGLFGHGVTSPAMTWMFIYPLLCGFAGFTVVGKLPYRMKSKKKYRLFFNLYNSGIASLTAGSLLQGILEIAGTGSPFVVAFYFAGIIMSLTGLGILISGIKAVPCSDGQNDFPEKGRDSDDPIHVE